MNYRVLLMVACLALPGVAGATNSRAELEGVARDLLAWMPGDYSSWPQVDMERRYGMPPDGEHEDWYRTFALIKAPQIGEHVLYGELRIGGPDGPLVKGSQVLYNVKIDETTHTVLANGRRIRNPEQFERAHERPDTWSKLEFDPAFGGSCDFRWTRHGAQVHGILNHDGTCHITSRVSGRKMMFDAEWTLTPTELWLFDNNYVLGPGEGERTLFLGREDRTHLRLYKVRWFSCDAGGKSYRLHDRGQEVALGDGTGANRLRLLRGYRVLPGEQTLSEVMSLALSDAKGALLAESLSAAPASTTISLQAGDMTASCRLSP